MTLLIVFTAACAAFGLYWLSCRIWPYGPCLKCVTHPGRSIGSNRRRWGTCRRCKGAGRRIRLGARLTAAYRDGKL